MSVIFNSGTEAALRTTNVVAGSSHYTCCFYLKLSAAGAGYRTAWMTADSIATPTQYVALFTDTATLNLKLWGDNGSGGTFTSTGATLVTNQWARIAYVRQGTTHRFYVNGVLIDADTLDMSGATLAEVQIGNDGTSDSGLEIAYFREWDTFLTLSELNNEWFSPVTSEDPGNLVTDTPLVNDLLDDSGNSNDWTAVGSLTFDATKPAFPANSTRATATVIASLPHSGTQNVWSEGLAYLAWFTYTAVDEQVISVWGHGATLSPYVPIPSVYVGAGTTSILSTFQAGNKPTRFSVSQGTEYFILFTPDTSAPASASLVVEAESFSQQTAPVGSIVVPDDASSTDFPLGIFSSDDGDDFTTLTYVNGMAVGEAGDVLDDGKFLISDVDAGNCKLYNGDMSLIATVALNVGTRRSIRCCRGQQVFYVGTGGNPCIVSKVDDTGAILQTWSMTGTSTITSIAASNDGTILYSSGTSDQAVRRWDLVNDVALSNFLASGSQTTDILILDDDTILIGRQSLTSSSANFTVTHYNAGGTLLHTYNFGTNLTPGTLFRVPCRMAYALDDPLSFWVYLHPVATAGLSTFKNILISDGSTIAEKDEAEFNQGIYSGDQTLTPLSLFGNSLSCPFFISRVEVSPPSGDTGTLIVTKVTVPESDATAFDFTASDTLSPDTFSLSHGESEIYNDVDVGTYSVEETPNLIYQTTVEVSNGSPNTAITVAAGETVTVTFTNSATYSPGFNTRAVKRRWLRRSPIFSKENARVRYKMFQLDCHTGTGTNAEPGMDPQVYMSYSDDWGQTWSFVMPMPMGMLGKYTQQLQWWRLGVGRNRVFEVYGSDPVKVALIDGFARVDPGTDSE